MAGDTLIKARKFVISTGSQPIIPKINGLKNIEYYTNENIFDLKELPKNLIIIGGGPIGMEMAQAYSRLGANVTVLEAKNILEKDDPEAVSIAIMQLKSDGVQIKENSLVINIEKDSDSIKVITSDGSIYNGSHLLIAAGRK